MKNKTTILLVEDDPKLSSLLSEYFTSFNFDVEISPNGKVAIDKINTTPPELVIVDLILPDIDGLSICKIIRANYSGKILMLTASGDDMDHVAALEIGADDFVQKPIQPRVLLARVRALLKRDSTNSKSNENEQKFGTLVINKLTQQCSLKGVEITLTPSEFTLLSHLAERAEHPVSRDELMQVLRNIAYDGLDRSIDNKISRLRKKLKDNGSRPKGIITVRSKGYMLIPDFWE